MLVLSSFPLSSACKTDFASEKMITLVWGFVFCLKAWEMWSSEDFIASASASKLEH